MKDNKNHLNWERLQGFVLALIVLISLIYFIYSPPKLAPFTLAVIRFFAASIAGWSGYLIGGSLEIKQKIGMLSVKAAGAFAAFCLVFALFFFGIPQENVSLDDFSSTKLIQKIENAQSKDSQNYQIISTANGNKPRLKVLAQNIPNNLSSKYKLVVFARKEDNPIWDCQGQATLSDNIQAFPLNLWDDPRGDKSYYSAISIISLDKIDYCSQPRYPQVELDLIARKQSEELKFYRDDQV